MSFGVDSEWRVKGPKCQSGLGVAGLLGRH